VLDEQGASMDDSELLELISERKTISKTVDDYEGRKSTSLTTAARLADFLGADMIRDKGLNCNLIISRLPAGAPVTERAIPVAIFSCEPTIRRYFLRKWLRDSTLDCDDFRNLVDWNYYKDRLGEFRTNMLRENTARTRERYECFPGCCDDSGIFMQSGICLC
jgi:DNA polymerase epsilon subunit 1